MKLKTIKAFTPLVSAPALFAWCMKAAQAPLARTAEVIEHFIAIDPAPTEWSSMGLVPPIDGESYLHNLDGVAMLLMYQFNDRILPGAVRDEKLRDRFKELTEKEGRALNKKEFAQLREDVEYALLPQAFIRRTLIPVLVYRDALLICTTSASKVEKIIGHLFRLCDTRNVEHGIETPFTERDPASLMGELARTGGEDHLLAMNSIVFKGENKRTIRIKDRDVAEDEVQKIACSGLYAVSEMGLQLVDINGDHQSVFTLTDRFIVKGIKLEVKESGIDEADAHATYWLFAKSLEQIHVALVEALNEDAEEL